MIRIGVKEVRQNLTKYLLQAQRGEEIIITNRDEPIARLVSIAEVETKQLSSHQALRLQIAGKGEPLSRVVTEQREERF